MAYFQIRLTWEDPANAPPLKTLPVHFLDRLDDYDCIRTEWPWLAEQIAAQLMKRGLLRLVVKVGKSMLFCADSSASEAPFMRNFKSWSTCRISKIHHADHPVLFFSEKRSSIGGRRGTCKGWTQRTIKSHRELCQALDKLNRIKGALTIGPLPQDRPRKLRKFQKSIQRLLKKLKIAHHGAWEGPTPHLHILLCSPVDEVTKKEICGTIFGCYHRHFGYRPHPPSNLVYLDEEAKKGPESIAKYCGKTRKRTGNGGGYVVKEQYVWLEWKPYFSHGLPMKRIREIIPTLPPTPPELCIKAMNRKKWESSRSK